MQSIEIYNILNKEFVKYLIYVKSKHYMLLNIYLGVSNGNALVCHQNIMNQMETNARYLH